jgi:prepilin-type processing-associated H-X9-DG protein
MASKPTTDVLGMKDYEAMGIAANEWQKRWRGGTFLAWGRWLEGAPWAHYSSFGLNIWCFIDRSGTSEGSRATPWETADVRGAACAPVMLDSIDPWTFVGSPPQQDAVPVGATDCQNPSCVNRHNGGVNTLFLDWSVRKVGIKELWTLKWHREYDSAGSWTKAGGVKPEDWPAWMRGFKEY